jgi:hypothetical protein
MLTPLFSASVLICRFSRTVLSRVDRIIVFRTDLVPDGRKRAALEELLDECRFALAGLGLDNDEESRGKLVGKVPGNERMPLN